MGWFYWTIYCRWQLRDARPQRPPSNKATFRSKYALKVAIKRTTKPQTRKNLPSLTHPHIAGAEDAAPATPPHQLGHQRSPKDRKTVSFYVTPSAGFEVKMALRPTAGPANTKKPVIGHLPSSRGTRGCSSGHSSSPAWSPKVAQGPENGPFFRPSRYLLTALPLYWWQRASHFFPSCVAQAPLSVGIKIPHEHRPG